MIRALIEQTFDSTKKYLVLFGLSTDNKPVSGLITGSEFHEVDTGVKYEFDEVNSQWHEVGITEQEIKDEIDAWLDDHPEATTTVEDGSITNAKLASSFVTPGTAAAYSSSATYAVGDYCFHNGSLYRCTTAITTAEAWTAAHWTAAVLGDDVGELKSALANVYEKTESYNIYDPSMPTIIGWLRDTGAVDATGTGANFATTDYIKIEKNTDYIIANERMNIPGVAIGSRILMALYDSSKIYISDTYQNVVGVTPMRVTFNSGDATYLRVSTLPMHMGIPTSEFALIVQKGSTLDGYTTHWTKYISKLYPQDNILFGKKYVACGDSLTAGDFTGYTDESGKTGVLSDAFSPEYGSYKTYPYWIASRNGMKLVNSGINGSVMAISKEYIDGTQSAIGYRSPFSLQRYKDIPADADYITLWFGVNDKDHTYLGTISDNTNETFYGAWNVVLPYLMENHPKAKIGIVITFGIPDSPYTQAVREVAEKWGVPYYDFPRGKQTPIIIRNKDTGYAVDQSIVDWKFNYYSVAEDNHHPNLIAHEYESTCLEAWLRSL